MVKKFSTLKLHGRNPRKIRYITFAMFMAVVDAYSLEECPTIVEIGAYKGNFTHIMSIISPSSRIFAIEADERVFNILTENTEKLIEIMNEILSL